ncbi:MAG: cysteine synthase family protein [Pirellulales bacterium]|nr:cysteine synthase family protein [Pirellulales bacterium]
MLQAIGNTPLVELKNLGTCRPAVRILCKLEGNNPGGSVKDRPAARMLQAAERSGELTPDRIVLEATSGNTGIALATICAAKGYRATLCMSAQVSRERRCILEALGAEVILTPAHEGTDGAIRRARQLCEQAPGRYYLVNQFENPYNVLAHYESTGPEIFQQTEGAIDVFVMGMGTTGTLMGVSRFLKERKPGVCIVGVEPSLGHGIQGLKNMQEAIRPKIFDPRLLDEKITVPDHDAFETTRRLARHEGLFVGMSSGASVTVALRIAGRLRRGTVVALLPDRGERYLSTEVFQNPARERVAKVA